MKVDFTNVKLKTNRLLIRDYKSADFNDFYQNLSPESFGHVVGCNHISNVEESWKQFLSKDDCLIVDYCGELIGFVQVDSDINYNDFDGFNCVQLYFALDKRYWGQQLMSEAITAVSDYCFNNGVDIIFTTNKDEDHQSKRVLQKSGFSVYKEYYQDDCLYQLNTLMRKVEYMEEQ